MKHTCSSCRSELMPGSNVCTNCGMRFDQPVPSIVHQAPANVYTPMMKRYHDAYLVANTTAFFGTIIKIFGLLLGGGIFVTGVGISTQQQLGDYRFLFLIFGLVSGIIAAATFFLLGVLVAAQGQILKASLDSAVNTSPFLADDQRTKIMSL